MRTLAIVILLTMVLPIGGCGESVDAGNEVPPPANMETDMSLPVEHSALRPPEDIEGSLVDVTWVSPALVQVGNFYPGARAEWNLRVHNGNDTRTKFLVVFRQPDYVKEGYVIAPKEAEDWVIVADPTPVLEPKETRAILVVLTIPANTSVVIPQQWEFWTSVAEQNKSMIQAQMCTRWLVEMR